MPDALQIDRVNIGDGYPIELYRILHAGINVATAADHTIVAASIGRKIRVTAIKFSVAGDVTVTWKSNATALGGAETFKEGGGMCDNWGPHGDFFETVAGEALKFAPSGAVQVSGWINYILV